jgi:hypothetical protein
MKNKTSPSQRKREKLLYKAGLDLREFIGAYGLKKKLTICEVNYLVADLMRDLSIMDLRAEAEEVEDDAK